MPRNRQHLSEQELFVKTTNMVEYVVDAKIRLIFTGGTNFCNFNGYETEFESRDGALSRYKKNKKIKFFSINIATPPQKHITQYTALLHELGHILYESPFTPMKLLLENWNAPKLYYEIFNILEDQRIESHLARSYIGYKIRFDKTTNDLGKSMKSTYDVNDPGFILLAIRFHRDDLVKNSKNYKFYKKALENVVRTDKFGSLRILISIKKYIEGFLSAQEGEKYSNNKNKKKTNRQGENGLNIPDHIKKQFPKNPTMKQCDKLSRHSRENTFPSRTLNTDNHSSIDSRIPNELLQSDYTDDEIDKIVNQGKAKGEKQFQKIRDKLLEVYRQDNSPSHIKKVERPQVKYKVDKIISKGLKKIFRLLKLRDRPFIDYTGYEVNVNEYIENFIKGTNLNRSYENNQKGNGASIVISIDGSGSMRSQYQIDTARNLVATLFDSIKGIPNIEIHGNVWSSNQSGDVGITEIKNIQDVKKISIHNYYQMTPTHVGLEYSMEMLKRMTGYNKLIILITDGFPNYSKNDKIIPRQVYLKTCRRSLQKVLKVTPNVLCISVSPQSDSEVIRSINEKLFGKKRIISVNNMQDASEKIIKEFRKFIVKNMVNPL